MSITDDLTKFEMSLGNLITRYEQYFIGLEKREPLPLLSEVEKLSRRYAGTPINNTMFKHKYNMLVARFNTYREHWNRTVRLMEEGKYSRDRFISDLRQRSTADRAEKNIPHQSQDIELERIFREFTEARAICNLPPDKITREMILAGIAKMKPNLVARLGTDDLTYRVVVEDGKPKIKAGRRK